LDISGEKRQGLHKQSTDQQLAALAQVLRPWLEFETLSFGVEVASNGCGNQLFV